MNDDSPQPSDRPDAPVSDAPISDTPVSDAPVSDAPVSGEPVADASFTDSTATDATRRPHPLDDDYDDRLANRRTLFTIRNGVAAAVTLFTSTLLAIAIGLPSSVGAMVGVWFATALLFGPLWFALANQNYAQRFSRGDEPKQADDSAESETMGTADSPFLAHASESSTTTETETATSPQPVSQANPFGSSQAHEPLRSYYQPLEVRVEPKAKLSGASYGIILLFATFICLLILAAPFLAALIVGNFG